MKKGNSQISVKNFSIGGRDKLQYLCILFVKDQQSSNLSIHVMQRSIAGFSNSNVIKSIENLINKQGVFLLACLLLED